MVASSLELLYGYMRVFWEEYDIPVIVTHGSRPILAVISNEATSRQQLRGLVLVIEEESVCEKRKSRYISALCEEGTAVASAALRLVESVIGRWEHPSATVVSRLSVMISPRMLIKVTMCKCTTRENMQARTHRAMQSIKQPINLD